MGNRQNKKAVIVQFEKLIFDENTNARQRYDGIKDLAEKIRAAKEVLTPLEVWERPDGELEVLAGFRRGRAIKMLRHELGPRAKVPSYLSDIPVQIFRGSRRDALVRNLAADQGRKDLRIWEVGQRCLLLREEHKMTAEQVAEAVGFSRAYVYQAVGVVTKLHPNVLAEAKRSDIGVDTLIRWSSKPAAIQLAELEAWQNNKTRQAATKANGNGKKATKKPQETRNLPKLLEAIPKAKRPKQWREGALAVTRWLLGETSRPPVPMPRER